MEYLDNLVTRMAQKCVPVSPSGTPGQDEGPYEGPTGPGEVIIAGAYYVDTNGNDSNPGTINQPFASWQKGFDTASAGDTVYIRGGTYHTSGSLSGGAYYGVRVSSKNGTVTDRIQIFAYPGEIPILDGTNVTSNGIHIGLSLNSCSYWHMKGLTIQNFTEYDNGGGSYDVAVGVNDNDVTDINYEKCVVRDCGNGFAVDGACDNIYYTNCDAYHNFDHYDSGGLANGFNANIDAGGHVYFYNCRSWENSDDGFDVYGSDGYVWWEDCWAFWNGSYGGETGNGSGIKLGDITGPKELGVQRTIINCLVFENDGMGIDESMDAGNSIIDMNIYNNTCYFNGRNFNFGNRAVHTGTINFTNNISHQYTLYTDQFRVDADLVFTTNSWQGGLTVSDADFINLISTGADAARNSAGDLPTLSFMHLSPSSDLINAGTDVGYGNDLGCFQS